MLKVGPPFSIPQSQLLPEKNLVLGKRNQKFTYFLKWGQVRIKQPASSHLMRQKHGTKLFHVASCKILFPYRTLKNTDIGCTDGVHLWENTHSSQLCSCLPGQKTLWLFRRKMAKECAYLSSDNPSPSPTKKTHKEKVANVPEIQKKSKIVPTKISERSLKLTRKLNSWAYFNLNCHQHFLSVFLQFLGDTYK